MNDRSRSPKLPIQHRLDWDVRGIIAVLSVLGVFSLAGLKLVIYGDAEVPAWAVAITVSVNTFYFATRQNGKDIRKDGSP